MLTAKEVNQRCDDARQEQLDHLRQWYPKGSTVYTVLRHVSKSGMSRVIGLVAIDPDYAGTTNEPIVRFPNYAAATVLGMKEDRQREGVKVQGGGMDMGFHLAYNLGQVLYGDGYALKHRWL